MKNIFKRIAYVTLGLIAVLIITAFAFITNFNSKAKKRYDISPDLISIPADSSALERGLILSVGCRHCHGVDMSGKYFFDDPSLGKLASSNLTGAKGSTTEKYTDEDWIRALRHGLGKNGQPLYIMPSESYTHLSDRDLGCLIAFLKTLKPKENDFDPPSFTTFAKVLGGAGQLGEMYPYNIIDHNKAKNIPHPSDPPGVEYGKYMANIGGCTSCHKSDFGGGKSPDPTAPPVANISKSGNVGKWTRDQFIEVFRSGKTPEGKILENEFMPFSGISVFKDEEIASIYDYIMTLPGVEQLK